MATVELPGQTPFEAVREYMPVTEAWAFVKTGFCVVVLKLFGPVHVNVIPEEKLVAAVRLMFAPAQTIELPSTEAVAVTGPEFTGTLPT